MKENSIEEDIKILEDFILKTDVDYSEYNEQIVGDISYQAIQHLLSDYKRVLKENEKYKRLSEMNLKNAEEFKNNMCEHRCLLKSENEELQRENEELKKFITEGITVAPHSTYKNYRLDFLRENFVSKKKIKDKIEELKKKVEELTDDKGYWGGSDLLEQIKVLQELLESEERK